MLIDEAYWPGPPVDDFSWSFSDSDPGADIRGAFTAFSKGLVLVGNVAAEHYADVAKQLYEQVALYGSVYAEVPRFSGKKIELWKPEYVPVILPTLEPPVKSVQYEEFAIPELSPEPVPAPRNGPPRDLFRRRGRG